MGGTEECLSKGNKSRKYFLGGCIMIFVTVGTHEQPFNRLIRYLDELKADGIVQEEVIIQTGFSTYEPQYCKWSKLFPYKDMIKNVEDARIIITHGGPASFIMPLQIGKVPVVVPRRYEFNEHVNNHQVDFTNAVVKRLGMIIPVYDIKKLENILLNYDKIIVTMSLKMCSNNVGFNNKIEELADKLVNKETRQ